VLVIAYPIASGPIDRGTHRVKTANEAIALPYGPVPANFVKAAHVSDFALSPLLDQHCSISERGERNAGLKDDIGAGLVTSVLMVFGVFRIGS
jgi:hypothetical protein